MSSDKLAGVEHLRQEVYVAVWKMVSIKLPRGVTCYDRVLWTASGFG